MQHTWWITYGTAGAAGFTELAALPSVGNFFASRALARSCALVGAAFGSEGGPALQCAADKALSAQADLTSAK